ncbi:response regulator [Dactylosporangium sp. CA-092794]|uniref:response regulator n=1 Tax=Dactylosporangium sp. CA-092794 TaxID=3239929 RepID=UPI003D926764
MGANILIVEDNPQSLELMSYLLSTHGHRVHGASTGIQALTLAVSEPVELVLLDLQLPDLDGYQVLRKLREQPRLATVNIVAVTAVAMVGDRERTLAAGFDHYMPKPINPRSFVAEIGSWLPTHARTPLPD